MKVLLVDDDQTFRDLLQLSFHELGFECFAAKDVKEARSFLLNYTPQYAILDLRMPGESGLVLIEELLDKNKKMRILVLTGFASHQTAVEAIKLGATHYLSKPVDFSEILEAFEKSNGDASVPIEADHKDLDSYQKEHVLTVLQKHHYNISLTAKELGLHRRTLQRKLQKWGIR